MTSNVNYLPEGYQVITPYLTIEGAAEAIEFYKKAFNAVERMRLDSPNGQVIHAELEIGGAAIMLGEGCAEMGTRSPKAYGGSPVSIYIYVPDVDSLFHQALAAGATCVNAIKDQFYGDRSGALVDPFGHVWSLATHIEDVSPEEIQKRAAACMKAHAGVS